MNLLAAFLKLIRWPNLFFIAMTQLLFQFCIYHQLFQGFIPANDDFHFFQLMAASICIAAAGYIINDYFDINIDEVNKPEKLVIDKVIHRRWAIAWHFLLSTAGIVLTILALPFWQKWYLIVANIFCVILLWFYSAKFKKSLLTGNLVISLLTSWTILIIFFSKNMPHQGVLMVEDAPAKFFRLAILYAGFAFIISLIREALKDMQDMPGDTRFGCRTMPIIWGVNATKVYVAVWLFVILATLIILQVYVLQFEWWLMIAYSIPLIIFPLFILLIQLRKAALPREFKKLSSLTKLVMMTGILSMGFFYYYL